MAKVYKGNITGNIVELSLQDEAAGGGGGGTVQTPSTLQIRAADEGTVPGDPRGANSVDLQTVRTASTQVASGSESMILGGHGNTASGPSTEIIGSHDSTTTGTGSTVIGGNTINNAGNWSIAAGGRNHEIVASRVGVLGGEHAEVLTGHNDSVMLGVRGTGATKKQSQAAQTAHVDNLYIFNGFTMPTGAADTYVLTSDANGVGTWQAAAGGGGSGGTIQGTQTRTYNLQLATEATGQASYVIGNTRGEYSIDLTTYRSDPLNVPSQPYSAILGGRENRASAQYSVVLGGYNAIASDSYSIAGGSQAEAAGYQSVAIGGAQAKALDYAAVAIGGDLITASGYCSAAIGGWNNTADGEYSWAGGKYASTGLFNNTFAWNDGGAPGNLDNAAITIPNATNQFAIKAAGGLRLVPDLTRDGTTTPTGYVLTADAAGVGTWKPAAGGGGGLFQDPPDAIGATERIGSGPASTPTPLGAYATISGGTGNTANGVRSTISGGSENTASGYLSTISGGYDNTASGNYSTTSGGYKNTASGNLSTVSGGLRNTANGVYSTVSGGADNDAIGDHSWAGGKYASTGGFDGTFAWNDGGAPGNLDITAITIPNAANQFAIKAAGGLRLIDGNEGANKVLTCDAAGVGTWQAAAGGGSGGTVQNANLSIEPTDEGPVPGDPRGSYSVDLQTKRELATQIAGGLHSTIVEVTRTLQVVITLP